MDSPAFDMTLRPARHEALAILEQVELAGERDAHVRIGADAEAPSGGRVRLPGKYSVTEVRLGDWAQSGDRAARRQGGALRCVDVGRVYEAPAFVDGMMIEQPGDRPRTPRGLDLLHFGGLLGDVQVNRTGRVGAEHLGERIAGHRAQRVRCDADSPVRRPPREGSRSRLPEPVVPLDVACKTKLPSGGCPPVGTARGVHHREQGQTDSGRPRGLHDAFRGFGRVRVGPSARSVVQVVELGDGRVPCLAHLDLDLGGDCADHLRRQPFQEPVHEATPAPEGVGAESAPLGASRQRTLKRVAVKVCRSREENAPGNEASVPGMWLRAPLHVANPPVRVDRDPDVARPAVAEECTGCVE